MAIRNIDRVLLEASTEAVRGALGYLMDWQVELQQRGQVPPDAVRTAYTEVRRLRQALERHLSSTEPTIALQLATEDADLLASCLIYEIAQLDQLASRDQLAASDEKRRDGLARLAVVLATRDLRRLPAKDYTHRGDTETARRVSAEVRAKFSQESGLRPGGMFGMPRARVEYDEDPPADPLGSGILEAPTVVASSATLLDDTRATLSPDLSAAPAPSASRRAKPKLVDATTIADPRLRRTLVLDLRAWARSREAGDPRLALLHLASILDGAVLDYVLPRRRDLGLMTPPPTWMTGELVEQVLGSELTEPERAVLNHLVRARRNAYPALQLDNENAVSTVLVQQAEALVHRLSGRLLELAEQPTPPAAAARVPEPEPPESPDESGEKLELTWNLACEREPEPPEDANAAGDDPEDLGLR